MDVGIMYLTQGRSIVLVYASSPTDFGPLEQTRFQGVTSMVFAPGVGSRKDFIQQRVEHLEDLATRFNQTELNPSFSPGNWERLKNAFEDARAKNDQ
jgi:hypothetical protein